MHRAVRLLVFTVLLTSFASAADWPQFRGPNSSGIYDGAPPPVEFGAGKNERWVVPVASGHSSPCIVGDSIFLTVFDEASKQLSVVCLATADGALRWRANVNSEAIEKGHPSFNPASSTPASDGERVVAYFGSYGLVCFDMNGNQLWDLKLPLAKSYGGNATSPIIAGDRVILYRGNYTDHFLLALDKTTGEQLWKTPQPSRFTMAMACTGTPVVAGNQLIVHSVNSVQAFSLQTGEQTWQADAPTTATSTPIIADDLVVVATWSQTGEPDLVPVYPGYVQLVKQHDKNKDGEISSAEMPRLMIFHRSEGTEAPENGMPVRFGWVDTDGSGSINADEWSAWQKKSKFRRASYKPHGVLAIDIDSQGLVSADAIRTLALQGVPEVPSPIYFDRHVYFVKNGGILTCVNLATGNREYRTRTGGRGTHYASPVLAGDKLYSTSGAGTISVIQLGKEPNVLAQNEVGQPCYATPAIVDGTLFVRSHNKLYAFAREE